ncbi:MAG: PIN domain-containing protein [Rhodanobacter sp.]|nr:MAG: PIN domain-containing protein [Rhodanobacter sp.]
MSFVLDNSVTMRWCFGDGKPAELAYAGKVLDALRGTFAQVPAIWGLEVANVLARAEDRGLITEARSEAFLALLRRMRIEADTETFAQSLGATLQLARRYRLSSYDAAYLELALREGLALATLDEDLRKAAKRAGVPMVT